MIIQHNIMALNAHRQLGGNNSLVQKNLEKLSSGYKINRAGDDAAGLAISEKMRAQITGLTRAASNAQDGISLVQTAEGALTEVHSMLNRMVDLSTQSANGTLKDDDRQKIQDEMNALTEEIDRISQSTNFNGINLLDGSLGGSKSGAGLVGGKIVNYKPSTTAAIAGADLSGFDWTKKDAITVDGATMEVDWSILTDAERSAVGIDWTGTVTADQTKTAASIMEKTINAAIDKYNSTTNNSVGHIKVKTTAAPGEFQFASTNETAKSGFETVKDAEVVGGITGNVTGLLAVLNAGAQVTRVPPVATPVNPVTDMGGKFTISIDGEEFEIDVTAPANAAGIAGALNTALGTALNNYETAKGLATDSVKDKISAILNDEGRLELVNTSGLKIGFSDKDGGITAKALGISSDGKAVGGGLTLQIGDTGDDFNKVTVSVGDMSASGLGISGIQVTKQGVSDVALAKIKSAINTVSTNRSAMGALQNRLEHTINNLGVATENMTAAESRIRDVDMAKEMMHFTKNNVLSQAAQAMLAQANQQPQQVLQLLR